MKQTTEEDGLLFTYAVHDGPGKSLNNNEEKHVHYFHILVVGDSSEQRKIIDEQIKADSKTIGTFLRGYI